MKISLKKKAAIIEAHRNSMYFKKQAVIEQDKETEIWHKGILEGIYYTLDLLGVEYSLDVDDNLVIE